MSTAVVHGDKTVKVVKPKGTPQHRSFTDVESDIIKTYFHEAIEAQKPPVASEAKEFLECNSGCFREWSSKDITDKVRCIYLESTSRCIHYIDCVVFATFFAL